MAGFDFFKMPKDQKNHHRFARIAIVCLSMFLVFGTSAHRYDGAISALQSSGTIDNGVTIDPDQLITKSDFVKTLVQSSYTQTQIDNCTIGAIPSDTPSAVLGHVCLAMNNNLILQNPNDDFIPDSAVTLLEVARALDVLFSVYGQNPNKLWNKGRMKIFSNNRYIPPTIQGHGTNLTWGEVSEMLYLVQNNITNRTEYTTTKNGKKLSSPLAYEEVTRLATTTTTVDIDVSDVYGRLGVKAYDNQKTYFRNELVLYDGTLYRATQDILVPENFNTSRWEEIASGSSAASIPDFSVGESYEAKDVVYYAGKTYRANTAISPGNFSISDWTQLASEVLDEDDFDSESATAPPSQRSVMAFIEAKGYANQSAIATEVDAAKNTLIGTAPTSADTMGELYGILQSFSSGLTFQPDTPDLSGGSFPTGAQKGALYIVGVGGTVDGRVIQAGDSIIALVDNASPNTYTGQWFHIARPDTTVDVSTAYYQTLNTGQTGINDSTPQTMLWNLTPTHNSNHAIFAPHTEGVRVLTAGDYRVTSTVYSTSSARRVNAGIQITINGVPQGVQGAGNYIRSANGHNEASATVTQTVTAAAGDIIGIESEQLGATGSVSAPAAKSVLIVEAALSAQGGGQVQQLTLPPVTPAIDFAELTNQAMANVNADPDGEAMIFNALAKHNSNATLFTPGTTGVTVSEDGWYEVDANLYYEANVQRVMVALETTVNGVSQLVRGAQGYIRNSNNQKEASSNITQILNLSAGDTVGIKMFQLGNTGVVPAPVGRSNLIIKKLR